ncbi:MAG TPA: ethanolamine ammonia-lyase [Verrucomicrobia bacterium]|nr:ethanolamine ammonia-lyase [Verrucomicrobiota bacterium]
MSRREFCGMMAASLVGSGLLPPLVRANLLDAETQEDIFAFISRTVGRFDRKTYQQLIGAANDFKEGDQILGVAAADQEVRLKARLLLSNTKLVDILNHPLFEDQLYLRLTRELPSDLVRKTNPLTLGELRQFLLSANESAIHEILDGLCSDVIGCVVKIMSNEELITVGRKIFNPLPGSHIGAKGYMGARIQPNSPTDHPDDVIWQILDGWSYATGDVVLGVNPAGSDPQSVALLEATLQDLRQTFQLEDIIPHSILAHIDIQAQVEKNQPGTTGIWFQSLAGSDHANATFDLTLEKMLAYAETRSGRYGFYFETGQGADFTNGSGQGTDMVIHESRKYGVARLLKNKVSEAQRKGGVPEAPWVHLNDVAGFIGPEVFRTREQLVRCCLEDIVMGKLHGLTIGLDICATLHMDITLDDLDWCQDQIMPANPAYLMALPTKNDPMLGYLTTAFQDHLRLREKFGYQVNEPMMSFFRRLGVIDAQGQPTAHFGDPLWVWYQYRRALGDKRAKLEIQCEGKQKMKEVRARGVYLAQGYDREVWNMEPRLDREIRTLYEDSKKCIWVEFNPAFIASVPGSVLLKTRSCNRTDYILHPQTGEMLDDASLITLQALTSQRIGMIQVQIIVSDGLNALAIMDSGHLTPYLDALKSNLQENNFRLAPEILALQHGRVRAGYRIGECLFGGSPDSGEHKAIIHIIGERPGTMHHTFSAYISAPDQTTWAKGEIDHNITRVVSGIADTALTPEIAAKETVSILSQLLFPEKKEAF